MNRIRDLAFDGAVSRRGLSMNKLKLASALVLTLAACASNTEPTKSSDVRVQRTVTTPAPIARTRTADARITGSGATSISGPAADVDLKSWNTRKIWSKKPNVAIVGYNVGAYLTAKETASTQGGFGSGVMGARSTLEYRSTNISPALIARIADLAYADLQSQFRAAGANVIAPDRIRMHPSAEKLGVGREPFEAKVKDGRAKKLIAVTGPSDFGGTRFASLGKTTFNFNQPAGLANDLNAVLVFPNAALDFVSTSGGGQRYFGRKARVEGTVQFSLDAASVTSVMYSISGRYADLSGNLTMSNDTVVDGSFARVEEWNDKLNGLVIGLSKTWGLPYTRAGKKVMGVTVEEDRYVDLALQVIKGYNAAIVADYVASQR